MTKHTIIFFLFFFIHYNSGCQTNPDNEKIRVVIPNCGIGSEWDDIKTDLNQEYWAVYKKKEYHNWDNFLIEKYEIKNTSIPAFLVKGLELKDSIFTTGQWINRMFYPGESMPFLVYNLKDEKNSKNYYIYASGKLVKTEKREFPYFSKIENYELNVVCHRDKTRQSIRKMDIPSFGSGGFEGGIFIYWIGDLNGDNRLDMLVGISEHYAGTSLSLFLSDNDSMELFKEYEVGACAYD